MNYVSNHFAAQLETELAKMTAQRDEALNHEYAGELKAGKDALADMTRSYALACQDARESAQERDDYRRQRDGLQAGLTKALETIAKMTTTKLP